MRWDIWDLRTAFVAPVVAGAGVSLVAEVVVVVSLPDGIQATNKPIRQKRVQSIEGAIDAPVVDLESAAVLLVMAVDTALVTALLNEAAVLVLAERQVKDKEEIQANQS